MGLYNDPYQYFGMLNMEMHRAIRLVVDTGLHSKGWAREQAIAYSLENEGDSKAKLTSEIERYMANPGQALSYKIGQLRFENFAAWLNKKWGIVLISKPSTERSWRMVQYLLVFWRKK